MRTLVGLALKREGWDVLLAASGRQGLEMARQCRPDVILLDLMMPDMDGLDVCESLRAEPRFWNTPILALTALAGYQSEQTARRAGFDEVITKPFHPHELALTVRNSLVGANASHRYS
jgi:DNA-binding response OmpR family regulator